MKQTKTLIICILLLTGAIARAQSPSPTVEIKPIDDAYVRGGGLRYDNFGANRNLTVKGHTAYYTRHTLIKFALPNISHVESAKFKIYCYYRAPGGTLYLRVYRISDDNWSENMVTFDNQPSTGASETTIVVSDYEQYYMVDLTNYVNEKLANGDAFLSLIIKDPNNSAKVCQFRSKENIDDPPILELTSNELPVPDPVDPPYTGPTVQRTIPVGEDAFVRGGSYADDNYGSALLNVKSGTPDYTRNAHLKFPISTETGIVSAKLKLYCPNTDGDNMEITVYNNRNDNWSESAITYNSQPSGNAILGTFTVSGPGEYIVDITDFAKEEAAGDGTISLILKDRNNLNKNCQFHSKEQGSNPPQLIIEEVAEPIDVGEYSPQYNGNISAIKWKGYDDTEENLYTYTYDELNRLKTANYSTGTTSLSQWMSGTQSDGFNVSDNFDGINYDLNGNILNLSRQGKSDVGDTELIDKLVYEYIGNQLQSVRDATQNDAGFKDGTNSETDYAYDENGNMTQDLNKGITSIAYNHLNLPTRIEKTVGEETGSVEYIYDAAGVKLAQIVYDEAGIEISRTAYDGEFIYKSEEGGAPELELIQTDEGRMVKNSIDGTWEYQYHLKDHLGNVRTTFTSHPNTIPYKNTFEPDDNDDDSELFEDADGVTAGDFNSTTDGSNALHLWGSSEPQVGSVIAISVAKGDKINATVNAKYLDMPGSGPSPLYATLAEALIASLTGGTTGVTEYGAGTISDNFGQGSLIGTAGFPYEDSNAPPAFLNLIFIPESAEIDLEKDVSFAYDQLGSGFTESPIDGDSDNPFDVLSIEDFEVPQNGYIVVYVSNEGSLKDVYFDDMDIELEESPVIQSDDYYPFGLTFNSYQRVTAKQNDYLYNGKELQDELDLNWLDYGARMFMPDIGRFGVKDRFSEKYMDLSSYQYAANNPIRYVDVNGDSIWIADGALHITGAVYDATGDHNSSDLANDLTSGLAKKLQAAFAEAGIELELDIQIRGVESMDDVSAGDHLWAIQNLTDKEGNPVDYSFVNEYKRKSDGATTYGNTAMINANTPSDLINTMIHEGGHTLGLPHFTSSNGEVSTDTDNPMGYAGPWATFLFGSWGDQRDGNFNGNQATTIVDAVNDNRVNVQGSYEKNMRSTIPKRNPTTWQKVKNWFGL